MKIISKKVLKKTKFLELVQTNYMDTKTRLAQWWWVRRPKSRKAVVIIAIVDGVDGVKRLVITREYRVPIEGIELGLPAGLIDDGETPIDAVKRELEEETGLIFTDLIHMSPPVLSSAGLTDESVHLAFVKAKGEPNKDKLEASEEIDTYLYDQTQVENILLEYFKGDTDYTIGKTAYSAMFNFSKYGDI